MARQKRKEEDEKVAASTPPVVTVEALRDYCGRALVLRKGDRRIIPLEVAQKIIRDHAGNEPIRIVKSLSSPFNKAIAPEETK